MNNTDLKKIIKEELQSILKEDLTNLVNLDNLNKNVSRNTMVGKSWNNLTYSLSDVMNEVQEFNSQYKNVDMKTSAGIVIASQKLNQIAKLLEEITPTIANMQNIELKG